MDREIRRNFLFKSEDRFVKFVSIMTGYPEEKIRCMRRQALEYQEALARWEGEGGA